ncbi:MAG: GNAT family N-acetyltransferase [Clostridia bacterium]|nr:GNAT family N-acetyltransferase [Clostridia bacterium]MBQ4607057.1 GNAT family N-acetyltransferase [Clostridia bacterium]
MRIVSINDCPAMLEDAVQWFSARWHIPAEAYRDSMTEGLRADAGIPKWYLAMEGDRIAGGCGIIANDFHDRPDLTPNLCALWVEEEFRCRGIAGELLARAVSEVCRMGYEKLYLVTDHTSFYERYGWTFLTMVNGDDGRPARLYEIRCGRV